MFRALSLFVFCKVLANCLNVFLVTAVFSLAVPWIWSFVRGEQLVWALQLNRWVVETQSYAWGIFPYRFKCCCVLVYLVSGWLLKQNLFMSWLRGGIWKILMHFIAECVGAGTILCFVPFPPTPHTPFSLWWTGDCVSKFTLLLNGIFVKLFAWGFILTCLFVYQWYGWQRAAYFVKITF